MANPTYTDLSRILGLPPSLVEDCWNSVSSDKTVEDFLSRLDRSTHIKCTRPFLKSLKAQVQYVSEDLAAIPFSTGISAFKRQNIIRVFWTGILAISTVHKNRKCFFKCLVAILGKVHGTTRLLRRPMPGVNEIIKVEELSTTIVLLLSRAIPQRFLLVFRMAMSLLSLYADSDLQVAQYILTRLFTTGRFSCTWVTCPAVFAVYRGIELPFGSCSKTSEVVLTKQHSS
ncbi:hypothetical protein DL96DRAFT_205724 [Flagelloscypha sp. PMI_526]|nr:hypothetical protein DL96DRAFT_205724 [Flagelloscypha sp. PMI_526]